MNHEQEREYDRARLAAMKQERDELQRQLAKLKERRFPVMHVRNRFPDAPGFIRWSVIEHHEACAQRNHSQSLDRLAQRGGLDPTEALAVMTNQGVFDLLRQKMPDDEVVAKLKDAITRQSPATGDGWLPVGEVPTEPGWWWTPDPEFPDISPGGVILRHVRLSDYDGKLWCGDHHVSDMTDTRWLKATVPPLPSNPKS